MFNQTSGEVVYKPIVASKYRCNLSSTNDILQLCANYPSGVLLSDIEDAYLKAKDDVKTLLKNKQLISIDSQARQGVEHTVLYPVDVVADGQVIDAEIIQLWEESK